MYSPSNAATTAGKENVLSTPLRLAEIPKMDWPGCAPASGLALRIVTVAVR